MGTLMEHIIEYISIEHFISTKTETINYTYLISINYLTLNIENE